MDVFSIVVMHSKNKCTVGDQFIIEDGHRIVSAISKRYVTMDDGSQYPLKWFNKWTRIERELHHKCTQKDWRA